MSDTDSEWEEESNLNDSESESDINSENEIIENLDNTIKKEDNENNYESYYMKKEKPEYLKLKESYEIQILTKFKKEKDELDKNYLNINLDNYVNNLYEYLINYSDTNSNEDFVLDEEFKNYFLKIIEKDKCLMYYFLINYVFNNEINEKMKELKFNNLCGIIFKNENFSETYNLTKLIIFEKLKYIEPLYKNLMGNNFYMQYYDNNFYDFQLIDFELIESNILLEVLDIQNNNNETIFHLLAKLSKSSKIYSILNRIYKKYKEIPIDLNIVDKNGNTFLMILAQNSELNSKRRKCLDLLRYLVSKKYQIKLNQINNNGETLFKIALEKRLYHLLTYLATIKIDLNMKIFNGNNHLKNIISYKVIKRDENYIHLFKNLLENQTTEILKTPDVFEFYRELSLIGTKHSRYLITNYPELNNNNIYYTIKKLFKYGDYGMFLKYIKKYPEYLDYVDDENMTLLIYVLKLNKEYDDRGNHLNVDDINYQHSLGIKTEEVIIELIKNENINLSHVDNDGNNAFMYICKNNYMCAFLEIIKKTGYDKYLINKDGYHALYLNSLVQNPDFLYFQNNPISQLLLFEENNYDLNIVNEEGNNLLINFIKNGHNNLSIINTIILNDFKNNNMNLINHKNKLNENILILFTRYLYNFVYIDELMIDYTDINFLKNELENENNLDKLDRKKKYLEICNKYIEDNNIENSDKKIKDNVKLNILLNILITETNDLTIFKNNNNQTFDLRDTILTNLIYTLKDDNLKKVLKKFMNKLKEKDLYDDYIEKILFSIHESFKYHQKIQRRKVLKKNKEKVIDYYLPEHYYDPSINFTDLSILYKLLIKNEINNFEIIFEKLREMYKKKNINLINQIDLIELFRYILQKNEYLDIYFKYLNYEEINFYMNIIQINKQYQYKYKDITNNIYIYEKMKIKLYEHLLVKTKNINLPKDLIQSMTEYIIDDSFYTKSSPIVKNIKITKTKINN